MSKTTEEIFNTEYHVIYDKENDCMVRNDAIAEKVWFEKYEVEGEQLIALIYGVLIGLMLFLTIWLLVLL